MLSDTKIPILLLVEDSEDDAFFFRRSLEKSGMACSVHHATNGAEAVEFLRKAGSSGEQNLPHVIFLDLKMPVLNGFEVLDWIRTQPFASAMQVVVLSGSEHPDDRQRAAELGATDYLVKPVKVSDFHRFLEDVCPPEMGARV
jgi:CheY-like chemotaxis protein